MQNWLEEIKAPKWYRYIFFRLNLISIRLKNDTLEYSTVLLMSLFNMFQSVSFIGLIGILFGTNIWLIIFEFFNPLWIIPFAILIERLNVVLLTYRNKWENTMKEFSSESKNEKKIGIVYLMLYCLISVAMFPLGLWLTSFNNSNYI